MLWFAKISFGDETRQPDKQFLAAFAVDGNGGL